jgi:hypothetical protein
VSPARKTAAFERPARATAQQSGPAAAELGAVCFPEVDGRRSTTLTCRAIVADAARPVDRELAARVEACDGWRHDYMTFLRELTIRAADPGRALSIAGAGLSSMRHRLVLESQAGPVRLDRVFAEPAAQTTLGTGEIRGAAQRTSRLEVPYRGRMLHGRVLIEQLERWTESGTVEPSFSAAVLRVVEHPEWLALPGHTVALIGAGAEIGPLQPLCAWGADVLAVDIPDANVWARIQEVARAGAGTVCAPLSPDGTPGVDVVAAPADTRHWLEANVGAETTPVLGMHAYADGGAHVQLTAAFDLLATALSRREPAMAIAYLATPTDTYLVPHHAVERARAAYASRRARRVLQAPMQALSGGRLYRPAYSTGAAVADALVAQQGPNYAVAKRLQRWRGLQANAEGKRVSFNLAPATWTRSVTKNRVLAAAYAGARHFGIEIFEPSTTRLLMAAMLVHDLHEEPAARRSPEELFSEGAAHGGLWTAAYEPRSALGLAALAGLLPQRRSIARNAR